MESPRELAEAVDAALAGLSCDVGELRAVLNRAKHVMLGLLRVPVSRLGSSSSSSLCGGSKKHKREKEHALSTSID